VIASSQSNPKPDSAVRPRKNQLGNSEFLPRAHLNHATNNSCCDEHHHPRADNAPSSLEFFDRIKLIKYIFLRDGAERPRLKRGHHHRRTSTAGLCFVVVVHRARLRAWWCWLVGWSSIKPDPQRIPFVDCSSALPDVVHARFSFSTRGQTR
jgi:hypothetical protein